MQKITDLVRGAIGIDTTRGDQLIVENVPFDAKANEVPEPPSRFGFELWLKLARYASLPLAVLLLALLVIRPGIAAVRGLGSARPQATLVETAPTVAALQARLRAEIESGTLPPMVRGASPLRQRLIEAAVADPRTAALVVKEWMEDGRDGG
jgi:flagellar biosynthesis/type III secretory pathway M-ring protein FliF/YscJ